MSVSKKIFNNDIELEINTSEGDSYHRVINSSL